MVQVVVCGLLVTVAGWSFWGLMSAPTPECPEDTTNRILLALTASVTSSLFALMIR